MISRRSVSFSVLPDLLRPSTFGTNRFSGNAGADSDSITQPISQTRRGKLIVFGDSILFIDLFYVFLSNPANLVGVYT